MMPTPFHIDRRRDLVDALKNHWDNILYEEMFALEASRHRAGNSMSTTVWRQWLGVGRSLSI